jgi:cytochrome c oxidase assembly protein subunit 11
MLIVVGMFGFGFALVPLYDLFCEVTGLGGRTGGPYTVDALSGGVDKTRLVRVNFVTNTNDGMPWAFWSENGGVRVHPGQAKLVKFFVRNPTERIMTGKAVPSVAPMRAAKFFHKTECFCFESQTLQPGETLEMPLRFIVDSELPNNIESINLSYAMFDVTVLVSPAADRTATRAATRTGAD